jgi:SAM-dependent methyltransferase
MSELLIGCGNKRVKRFTMGDSLEWDALTTMDHDPNCGADILHDLDVTPWPVADNAFDEVHAYEVLEHLGTQGDYKAFFRHFYEIWRVLRPGGHLIATVPSWRSVWAWGDPSHTRQISPASIVFLSQQAYRDQVGKTPMTDFRWLWKGDLETIHSDCDDNQFTFVLRAVKDA